MKKLLAKAGLVALSALLVFQITLSDINSLPYRPGVGTEKVSGDHVDSESDTVIYTREPGLEALAFAAHWKDSVSVTRVVVRRIVDGDVMASLLGDTLTPFSAFSDYVGSTGSVTAAVTLAPLADQYYFIVVYAGSNNGVTTPTVIYEAIKQTP